MGVRPAKTQSEFGLEGNLITNIKIARLDRTGHDHWIRTNKHAITPSIGDEGRAGRKIWKDLASKTSKNCAQGSETGVHKDMMTRLLDKVKKQ